jgi:DNA polymerase IV
MRLRFLAVSIFYVNPEHFRIAILTLHSGVTSQAAPRAIIHLDMDCFYAAIEVRDRPALRGKPVGVGGARDRRGVLTTCNYEARAFGIHSAMPTFMALQRCPNLIVLPTRFDVYRREAAVVREILHRFSPLVEPLSLDEAYLDVTEHPGAPGPLAQVIRDLIFQKTKLTASAGIAPNKLIAKIASAMCKPNGQLEVTASEVPAFMENLPVREIWGIGEKTERRLNELGVKTCGELQRFSRPELVDLFGKFGSELFDLCRGIDDRPVEPDRPRKSLSTEETFPNDLETLEQCEERLAELFQDLMADLEQKETNRRITKIFVKLKFADFTRTTAERAGLAPSLPAFQTLLAEAFARTGKKVRLIGVGVRFAETEPAELQMPLFSETASS